MADQPTTTETSEDQGAMAQSYFDMYEPDDGDEDSGVISNGETVEGDTEITTEGENDEQDTDDTAEGEEETDGKKDGGAKAPGNFESRFLTAEGEDGSKALNPEELLSFLGDKGNDYEYTGRAYAKEGAPERVESESPAWKKELEEEQTFRDNITDNMLLYDKALMEALQAGHQFEQARQVARQHVDGILQKEFKQRDFENQVKWRESNEKQWSEQQTQSQIAARAATNEQARIQQVGGQAAYQDLMFNHGGKIINKLYDLMNPSASGKFSQAQMGQELDRWWKTICADKSTYDFVNRLVLADWTYGKRNELIKFGKKMTGSDTATRQSAKSKAPRGYTRAKTQRRQESNDGGQNALQRHLRGTSFASDIGEIPEI